MFGERASLIQGSVPASMEIPKGVYANNGARFGTRKDSGHERMNKGWFREGNLRRAACGLPHCTLKGFTPGMRALTS